MLNFLKIDLYIYLENKIYKYINDRNNNYEFIFRKYLILLFFIERLYFQNNVYIRKIILVSFF